MKIRFLFLILLLFLCTQWTYAEESESYYNKVMGDYIDNVLKRDRNNNFDNQEPILVDLEKDLTPAKADLIFTYKVTGKGIGLHDFRFATVKALPKDRIAPNSDVRVGLSKNPEYSLLFSPAAQSLIATRMLNSYDVNTRDKSLFTGFLYLNAKKKESSQKTEIVTNTRYAQVKSFCNAEIPFLMVVGIDGVDKKPFYMLEEFQTEVIAQKGNDFEEAIRKIIKPAKTFKPNPEACEQTAQMLEKILTLSETPPNVKITKDSLGEIQIIPFYQSTEEEIAFSLKKRTKLLDELERFFRYSKLSETNGFRAEIEGSVEEIDRRIYELKELLSREYRANNSANETDKPHVEGAPGRAVKREPVKRYSDTEYYDSDRNRLRY